MKIAVIGSGGREHALCVKLNESPRCDALYCIPGNGGTENIATNIPLDILDIEGIVSFAKEHHIDLTIVGPEAPLAEGIVDAFEKENLKVFGPNKKASQLESSKAFSKDFMEKYNIPTAKHVPVASYEEGLEALKMFNYPCVIKADGLCAGKGVVIAKDKDEALKALDNLFHKQIFGDMKVVIETFLDGFEVSQICLVSKDKLIPLETAQDYKRIGENDTGENTGGVGCFSPTPKVNPKLFEPVYTKIEQGLKEEDLTYYGVLFIGFMIVDDIPYVLEFNTRFGDPETQVLMPRLESDLVEVITDTMEDKPVSLLWKEEKALVIILTSGGYPATFNTGYTIQNNDYGLVYHNGTKLVDDTYQTSGGRVLTVVEMGDDFKVMNQSLLKRIEENIDFKDMKYRKDIGLDI